MRPITQRERHHRVPRSRGGSNSPRNISVVEAKYHHSFHHLFSNMLAEEIAELLNAKWIDPDKQLICVSRKEVTTS